MVKEKLYSSCQESAQVVQVEAQELLESIIINNFVALCALL